MSTVYDFRLIRTARQLRLSSYLSGPHGKEPVYCVGELERITHWLRMTAENLSEIERCLDLYEKELDDTLEFNRQCQTALLLEDIDQMSVRYDQLVTRTRRARLANK